MIEKKPRKEREKRHDISGFKLPRVAEKATAAG